MRGAIGLCLWLGLGCDALATSPSVQDEPTPDQQITGSAGQGGSSGSAGSVSLIDVMPVLTLGGAPPVEPEPEWCETAERNGATFCESAMTRTLEYCEPAPADAEGCIAYDRPPAWVYDLLLQCIAHCGVGIAPSERALEGSCCYFASSEYYGR